MAKGKKKKTGAARRVGGISKSSPLFMYGSIAAGFLLGDKLNTAIDKATGGKIDTKIVAAGQAGLGALLVFKKGGKKSMIKTIAGGVLLGSGVKRGMTAFGIGRIGGYQSVPAVSGYQQVPAVGGRSGRRIGSYNGGNHFANNTAVVGSGTGLMSNGGSMMSR